MAAGVARCREAHDGSVTEHIVFTVDLFDVVAMVVVVGVVDAVVDQSLVMARLPLGVLDDHPSIGHFFVAADMVEVQVAEHDAGDVVGAQSPLVEASGEFLTGREVGHHALRRFGPDPLDAAL